MSLISCLRSVFIMVLCSGHEEVMSTNTVVGGAGVHEKKTKKEKGLIVFGNNISVYTSYAFLHCIQLSANIYIVEGSIMQLARLSNYLKNKQTCIEQSEGQNRDAQNVYPTKTAEGMSKMIRKFNRQR